MRAQSIWTAAGGVACFAGGVLLGAAIDAGVTAEEGGYAPQYAGKQDYIRELSRLAEHADRLSLALVAFGVAAAVIAMCLRMRGLSEPRLGAAVWGVVVVVANLIPGAIAGMLFAQVVDRYL